MTALVEGKGEGLDVTLMSEACVLPVSPPPVL